VWHGALEPADKDIYNWREVLFTTYFSQGVTITDQGVSALLPVLEKIIEKNCP
jgi:hypothetical protein